MNPRSKKACVDCGTPMMVEMPEGEKAAALASALGLMCDSCAAREARADAQRQQVAQESARQQRVTEAGLPAKLRDIRFESLDRTAENDAAMDRATDWGNGRIKGLVLQGPVGVGKTWTAAAAANLFLDRKPLRWMSVSRMLAQARAGFKTKERDEVTAILLNPNLPLVLDDIDKANPTEFAKDILFQAIDERVNADTPLLVTTNKRYNELHDTYGEAIASRLAGYCVGVRIEGEDRRQHRAK